MVGDQPRSAFQADLDAAAQAALSLDTFTHLTEEVFAPGQFAEFMQLDVELRAFVLRVLGGLAGREDYEWFDQRNDAKAVASWMLELPGLRRDRT